jgi:hypothetical protein
MRAILAKTKITELNVPQYCRMCKLQLRIFWTSLLKLNHLTFCYSKIKNVLAYRSNL